MKNKEDIDSQLKPLLVKNTELSEKINSYNSKINSVKEENLSLTNQLEESQKLTFSLDASINNLKNNIQKLQSLEDKTRSDLDIAKLNYEDALKKEESMENLSPKQKAFAVLDNIINLLGEYNFTKGGIQDKATQLKELLGDILQIASAQSKSLTDQLLKRQNELKLLLESTAEDHKKTVNELSNLNTKKKNQI